MIMSGTLIKVLSLKDSAFASGSRKKFKKKKHRNKYRNSGLKKKRLRKFHSTNKTNFYRSNIFKSSRIGEKIMSNWYWSNYKKAIEWQNKHKVAHWKSCALALLEENRYLLQIINSMHPSMVPKASFTQKNLNHGLKLKTNVNMKTSNFNYFPLPDDHNKGRNSDEDNVKDNCGTDDNDEIEENDDFEFEMSEEMMEFFTQSYKHKMDLKKLQEKELENNTEQEIKQIQSNKIKRSTEMNFLYGDGASMIIGMETAVQLSFDKYCDTKSPKYWPNIPFKL